MEQYCLQLPRAAIWAFSGAAICALNDKVAQGKATKRKADITYPVPHGIEPAAAVA